MADDTLKGTALLCALDERTCLACLELDGTDHRVPVHDGCRCVVVPIPRSWAELTGLPVREPGPGTRSSAIGQVPADGGLYKSFLIQRQRVMHEDGDVTPDVAQRLREWLERSIGTAGGEPDVVASIRAMLLGAPATARLEDLVAILRTVRWNAEHGDLFRAGARAGASDALAEQLERMRAEVPEGPYAGRHRGVLFRDAAAAAKAISMDRAIEYLESARGVDPGSVTILVELAALQRRASRKDDALHTLEVALRISPDHKAARREYERLMVGRG
jgi:hypothetical protein